MKKILLCSFCCFAIVVSEAQITRRTDSLATQPAVQQSIPTQPDSSIFLLKKQLDSQSLEIRQLKEKIVLAGNNIEKGGSNLTASNLLSILGGIAITAGIGLNASSDANTQSAAVPFIVIGGALELAGIICYFSGTEKIRLGGKLLNVKAK